LQALFGANVPVVFLLGPCGDLTQVDNRSVGREFGPEYADMMGHKLAGEVWRTLNRAEWLPKVTLASTVARVPVRLRADPDVDAERPAFGLGSGATIEKIYVEERQLVAAERQQNPTLSAEVQALRVGPLGLVTNGAELFCELGLRIKACSPHAHTWVSTLTNETLGYVPTPQAFLGGGYEPRTARTSKLAPDVGQRLVEASLRALQQVLA
jgi:hypothetical protein